MWWIIWTLVAVAAVLGFGIFLGVTNTRLKTRYMVVTHAREGLELQIQKRHEIVEAILDPIQRDGSFDLDSTDNVSFLAKRARNTTKFSERGHFECALAESLKDLLTAVDNSPELSVVESYARPRQLLDEADSNLRNTQRFFNDSVQQYSAIRDSIPNRFVAVLFSFPHVDPVEIASAVPDPSPAIADSTAHTIPSPKTRGSRANQT